MEIQQPEITNNIPYPARGKYRWRSMNVNDSFLVRGVSLQRMSVAAYGAGKRLGCKFSARKTPDGIRVWRIA